MSVAKTARTQTPRLKKCSMNCFTHSGILSAKTASHTMSIVAQLAFLSEVGAEGEISCCVMCSSK